MSRTLSSRTNGVWLGAYAMSAAIGLTALSIAPPATGAMLLVPMGRDAPVVELALNRGAAIMGSGPGATIVVRGARARLFWALLGAGVLTIAAPANLCGGDTR